MNIKFSTKVFGAVVSAFLLMNFLSFKTNHGEEMAVPDLSKMQFSIAEEKLAEMGLEIVLLDTVDFKDEMPPFSGRIKAIMPFVTF